MKQILLSNLILCISIIALNAQCTIVNLSTQADVNNFSCSGTITSLIIDDGGSGSITSLDPIFFSGLTEIADDLVVRNCPNLTSLLGLDAITSVGDLFIIENTGISSVSTDAYPLILQSAGTIEFDNNDNLISCIAQFPDLDFVDNIYFYNNDALQGVADFYDPGTINSLRVRNNPNLTVVNGFSSTSTVDFVIEFEDNPMLDFIPTFNTLLSVTFVVIDNTALTSLDDFGNVETGGAIFIANNTQLSSITAFASLTGLVGVDFNYSLGITENPALTEVTGFSNMQLLINLNATNALTVTNNASLGECCWLLPLIDISPGSIVLNNSSGCNSIPDIGSQAPNITCPSSFSVSVDAGSCMATVPFTNPIPTDDCNDIVSYELTVDMPGLTITDDAVQPGSSISWELPIGVSDFIYVVQDGNGLISVCSTSVTVVDEIAPTWNGGGNSMTIMGVCGVDNLNTLYNNNIPTASDNCGGTNIIETTTLSSICGGSTSNEYVFNVTDDAGNSGVPYTLTIVMEDTSGPQLSGIPADMTINCDDNFPNIPSPTATDVCAGNLTNDILNSFTITPGDCSFNEFAEIHSYTWSVDDGCGNITTANWNVTVINDFSFDLGPDVADCDDGQYTINPGNIGSAYLWSTGATSQSITVTSSDTYSLTVTSNNGCCAIDEIDVVIGFAPDVSATGNTLDCSGNAVMIFGNSNTPGVTYNWSGPGGFTSTNQNPTVSELGFYTLTVTSTDMCSASTTVEVVADVNVPDVSATGGTIDCENSSVVLMGSSSVSGVTYNWTGPGGFSSNLQNPEVSLDGVYTLEVTAPNDCSASQSTVVDLDADIPSISIIQGDADCGSQTIMLLSNSNTNGLTYTWTGPAGFTSTDMDVEVSESGTYTVEIEASNGCSNSSNYTIEIAFEYETTINTTPATGADGGTAELFIDGGTGPFNVSWDNGTTGFSTSNLSAGTHTVTIQDGYGCIYMEEFEITMSTAVQDQELAKQIQIFPNPTQGELTILMSEQLRSQKIQIRVLDARGQQILNMNITQENRLDLSQLPDGLYLLHLQVEDRSYTYKILKTK